MFRLLALIYLVNILTPFRASGVTYDIGVTGIKSSSTSHSGVGFNLDLIFGKRGNQLVVGTTKALQKNVGNDLYRSTEMLDLNWRFRNLGIGVFYGGVVFDVEDFLSSWNFNRINYQHGVSFELFFRIAKSWNLGVEARRHFWANLEGVENYYSYWINLNYLFGR